MSADTVGAPVVAGDCMTCIGTLIRVSSEPNQHADAYVREEACLFLDARERSEGRILWRVSDNSAAKAGKELSPRALLHLARHRLYCCAVRRVSRDRSSKSTRTASLKREVERCHHLRDAMQLALRPPPHAICPAGSLQHCCAHAE